MYTSIVITAVVVTVSLWIVVSTTRLWATMAKDAARHRFFAHSRVLTCDASGRGGVSLLCRDTNDDERLRNLTAVEYTAYEVIVVSDSLRHPDSLKRIISNYHMVAVDGGISDHRHLPRVRRMYRSVSRCYRRLLLLDVATTDEHTDLDVAANVATYDYLLPLWSNEHLRHGAIERLVAEIYATDNRNISVISTRMGAPLTLISGSIANRADSLAASVSNIRNTHSIYSPLAYNPDRRSIAGHISIALVVAIIVSSAATALSGLATMAMSVIALSLLFVVVMAYAATTLTMYDREYYVGYGDTLSLFCKNLLPQIWKIRK